MATVPSQRLGRWGRTVPGEEHVDMSSWWGSLTFSHEGAGVEVMT